MRRYRALGGGFQTPYKLILLRGIGLGYTIPSPPCQYLQNKFLNDLIAAGIFTKLDCLYVMAMKGGSKEFCCINWKNPSLNLGSLVDPTSITLTDEKGIKGSGTVGYLNTNYTPSIHGVNYTQNLASFGVAWTIAAGSSSSYVECGAFGSRVQVASLSAQTSFRINRSGGLDNNIATTPVIGLYHVQRVLASGTNAVKLYRNGVFIGGFNTTSTARPNREFYVCGDNQFGFGNSSPQTLGMFFAGDALSGLEATFNTIYQEYITELALL